MGFLNRLFKPKVEDYSISSRYRFLMGPTAAGKTVNERSAMQLTAVVCLRAHPCRRHSRAASASVQVRQKRQQGKGGRPSTIFSAAR